AHRATCEPASASDESSEMRVAARPGTIAACAAQHDRSVRRADANPRERRAGARRGEAAPQARPDDDEELVVVATGNRGGNRIVAAGCKPLAGVRIDRQRGGFDDGADAARSGDLRD